MTRVDRLAAVTRLTAMLDAGVGGHPDTHNAIEVSRLLGQLEAVLPDPYGRGKIRSARTWADILFSVRKHKQWSQECGATVRAHMRADLANAERTVPRAD